MNYLAYINYIFGRIRASRYIHKRLIEAITGSTLRSDRSNVRHLHYLTLPYFHRWLDSTPTGRIIARCTQDIRAGELT